MKTSARADWETCYQAALRRHLHTGRGLRARSNLGLGRRAVQLGLETLDVARIHARAMHALITAGTSPCSKIRMAARSQQYFNVMLEPIEKTHRVAKQTTARVRRVAQTLRRRTAESFASSRNMKQGIARRQAVEIALDKSGHQQARLLQDSNRLEKQVRRQTHTILTVMEREWLATSRQLQNEIAQTLLAIHVRLLTLKNKARLNTVSLKKEIGGTQRLVKHSVQAVRKLAHELSVVHEA